MSKNPFGKRRPIDNPYAVYVYGSLNEPNTIIKVLQTYKMPENEDCNSIWYVATSTEWSDSFEYADAYAYTIFKHGIGEYACKAWEDHYVTFHRILRPVSKDALTNYESTTGQYRGFRYE